ncbi:hypothetical protein KBD45_03485 [Candidatus Dojkabacteria bacterium]|nr:hypothetical protein [Candidatus Dojkabacteria bacterium]
MAFPIYIEPRDNPEYFYRQVLNDINTNFSGITSGGTGSSTYVQNGLNTYTGGTASSPTVNISAATLNNLYVSGFTTGTSVVTEGFTAFTTTTSFPINVNSLGGMLSQIGVDGNNRFTFNTSQGFYNFYYNSGYYAQVFNPLYAQFGNSSNLTTNTGAYINIASATTTQAQINLYSGATPAILKHGDIWNDGSFINLNPGIKTINLSATTISGGTLYSGSTNLYDIFSTGGGGTSADLWSSSTGSNSIIANNNTGNLSSGIYASVLGGTGNTASGNYASVLGGTDNIASGTYSSAEGFSSQAQGTGTHAEGRLSNAYTDFSHAEGNVTISYGTASHAEGSGTTAGFIGGHSSHSEGQSTFASGNSSHAEGRLTTARGDASHAEGNSTLASGLYSHAEGDTTTSSGQDSHSEGLNTLASGLASHAEGGSTTASGNYSHAEGVFSVASGGGSHAEGGSTTSSGLYSHAGGQFSIASGNTSFVHGNLSIAGGTNTNVFGASLTGLTNNTTYVDYFNINRIYSGTPTISLGLDSLGNVVTGTTVVDGTGIVNYVAKWSSTTGIANSVIYDDGTNIGIGTTSPTSKMHVMSTLNDGIKTESIQSGHYILASPGNGSFGPNITSSYALELKTPSAEIRLGRTGGTGNALIYVDSTITTGLNISASAGGSPNLTLLSNENVGAGTSSPLDKIHINNGTLRINDTGSTYGTGKLAVSDVNGSISFSSTTSLGLGSGTVGGTGTTNYVTKWSSTTGITNSVIYDDGTNVGIGTASPLAKLEVKGTGTGYTTSALALYSSASTKMYNFTDKGRSYHLDTTGTYYLSLEAQGTTGVAEIITNKSSLYLSTAAGEYQFKNTAGGRVLLLSNGQRFDFSATVGGAPNVTIDTVGNLGIGTITPNSPLHVVGKSYLGGGVTAETLNIQILTGTSVSTLGIDSQGRVVSGATGGSSTFVQPGLNTYTGGTDALPTINISAATLTYLSATTISASTYYGIPSVFGVGADGQGGVLTTGVTAYRVMDTSGTITGWDIVSTITGNCVFDVWKASGGVLPTVLDTIIASGKPTLTGALFSSSTAISTWTATTFNAGDIIGFNLDSVTGITKANLNIRYLKS